MELVAQLAVNTLVTQVRSTPVGFVPLPAAPAVGAAPPVVADPPAGPATSKRPGSSKFAGQPARANKLAVPRTPKQASAQRCRLNAPKARRVGLASCALD